MSDRELIEFICQQAGPNIVDIIGMGIVAVVFLFAIAVVAYIVFVEPWW